MPDMLLPLQRTNSGSKTPSDEELHSAAIMLLLLDSIQIEQTTRRQMILREKELKMSTEVLKALSLLPGKLLCCCILNSKHQVMCDKVIVLLSQYLLV